MTRHIVWFKRDLRLHDHASLAEAARSGGELLLLYILEPDLWRQPDYSRRHYICLLECLEDLRASALAAGGRLVLRVGEAVPVLEALFQEQADSVLWSHEETGNGWTYDRDRAVAALCRARNVPWREMPGNGVVRRLRGRDGWAGLWNRRMSAPVVAAPALSHAISLTSQDPPSPERLGLANDGAVSPWRGGRRAAIAYLDRFLHETGQTYRSSMSSPLTGETHCSRLSVALAFGCLSVREVYQATRRRRAELQELPPALRVGWGGSLSSFEARLRWHCHFIQKLEDQPDIEFRNLHPLYDGLREDSFDERLFSAWKDGRTGYPMIDASMRYLSRTGWLNFRMRAMLVSFASHHLWLHWRATSLHLAKLFTDYEPGIHYPQVQMQAGTTGINTVRIYNPIKQGYDQDPEGVFIRREIPELAGVALDFIHQPWLAPEGSHGYPRPVVEEPEARRAAAKRIYGLRKGGEHRQLAASIVEKHGSRKKPGIRRRPSAGAQQELF